MVQVFFPTSWIKVVRMSSNVFGWERCVSVSLHWVTFRFFRKKEKRKTSWDSPTLSGGLLWFVLHRISSLLMWVPLKVFHQKRSQHASSFPLGSFFFLLIPWPHVSESQLADNTASKHTVALQLFVGPLRQLLDLPHTYFPRRDT